MISIQAFGFRVLVVNLESKVALGVDQMSICILSIHKVGIIGILQEI